MRFALLCMLLASHLFSSAKDPYALAVTEGDPSSLVEGIVSTITGDLYLAEEDIIIQGHVPIRLPRFYVSGDGSGKFSGWSFIDHLEATYRAVDKSRHKITVQEPGGSSFAFEGDADKVINHYKENKKYTPQAMFVPKRSIGITNTSQGEISGRTNLTNAHILLDPDGRHFTLNCPNRTSRRYRANHKQSHFKGVFTGEELRSLDYFLQSETLPSGCKIIYSYDGKDRVTQIRTTNSAETKTYAWARFNYAHENPDKSANFTVTTSDGRLLCYGYKRVEGHSKYHFLLQSVTKADAPSEHISYHEDSSYRGRMVGSRWVAGSRYMRYNYYRPGKNLIAGQTIKLDKHDPIVWRVMTLDAPVGQGAEAYTTHRFYYEPPKGLTDVIDLDGARTRFTYSPQTQLLQTIHRHLPNKALAHFEAFSWNSDGDLLSRGFYDPASRPYFVRSFVYDGHKNVIEEKFTGNLTGAGSETAVVKRSYTQDERNLLARQEDPSGKVTLYNYLPNAALLSSKFICDGAKITSRHFYEYSADLVLIREIVDDGSSSDKDNLSGVKTRKITETAPMPDGPYVDMPWIIAEKYWDGAQEVLLGKTVLSYTTGGLVDKKEVYDANGALCYTLTTEYDALGRPIAETNALGQKTIYGYDEAGNRNYVKECSGRLETFFTYDCSNRLVATVEKGSDGLKRTLQSVFDGKHRKTTSVDRFDNATYFGYDIFGHVVATTLPAALDENGNKSQSSLTFAYDGAGRQISSTNAKGETTHFSYNARNQKTAVRHPDGTEEKFFYNLDGTLKAHIDQEGNKTSYAYDVFGRKISETNALGQTTTYGYDAFNLLSVTDAEGHTTLYSYDGAGRKVAEERNGERTEYGYDPLGRLFQIKTGDLVAITLYDLLGRKIEERQEDSQGTVLSYEKYGYDEAGNQTSIVRSVMAKEEAELFAYDSFGRLICRTNALGQESLYTYDEEHINALGQKVLQKTSTDPLGRKTIETHDAFGRIVCVEIQSPEGKILALEEKFYDKAGNLARQKSTIYPSGRAVTTLWTYGPMNRLKSLVEAAGTPEQKTTSYFYDKRGLLCQTVKPDGVVLERTYDALGNLKTLASSDKTISYRYDYNNVGALIASQDASSGAATLLTLDHRGRILQEKLANGLTMQNAYDLRGRRTELILPDRSSIAYKCGTLHLSEVIRKDSEGFTLYSHLYREHDLSGNVLSADLASKGAIFYSVDPLGRAVSVEGPAFTQEALCYDSAGNLLTLKTLGDTAHFSYDGLYQLTQEAWESGRFSHEYSFDSHHNRLSKDSKTYEHNSLHQLKGLTYDPNGNPLARNGGALSYDALDRLIAIETPSERIRYTYDAFHRRISKSRYSLVAGVWQLVEELHFLYDGQNEIGSSDSFGKIVELRVLGKAPNAEIGAAVAFELYGTAYAVLSDLMGNVAALFTLDGQEAEICLYGAFGDKEIYGPSGRLETSALGNPWQYASKRCDPETGLIFYGRRYYDPELGRWLTPDPQGFGDGMNLYAFVGNSPLTHIDLYGLEAEAPSWVRDNWVGSLPGPGTAMSIYIPNEGYRNYTMPGKAGDSKLIVPRRILGQMGEPDLVSYNSSGPMMAEYIPKARMTEPRSTQAVRQAGFLKNAGVSALSGIGRCGIGLACLPETMLAHAAWPLYWLSGRSNEWDIAWRNAQNSHAALFRGWEGWMQNILPQQQRASYYSHIENIACWSTEALAIALSCGESAAVGSSGICLQQSGTTKALLNGPACSSANAVRLRNSLIAREISGGHAFEKHILRQKELSGLVKTREQFRQHIENVLDHPTGVRELRHGRSAYWQEETGTVVVRNPKASDGGTAFQPRNGVEYFLNDLN